MSKLRKILSILLGLAMVLTIAGVASAKTYDFTNTPLLHEAYEGCD